MVALDQVRAKEMIDELSNSKIKLSRATSSNKYLELEPGLMT